MKPILFRSLPALLAALILAGCGGGGGDGNARTTLGGTAATGAPVVGGQVSVSCGSAAVATTTTGANGTWQVQVVNAAFPCLVTVSGGSLAAGVKLYGYATSATNVNVTPLTSLIGAYATKAANGGTITQAMLDAAVTKVNDLLVAAGFAPLPANPLTAQFTPAKGDAYDDYIETVMAALAEQNVTIDSLVDQIVASGAPAAPIKGPDVVGFDSMPSPFPANMPSLGFEAEGVTSLGERLTLAAGSARTLRGINVAMSSWACQSGGAYTSDCASAANATFSHPITLHIYDASGTLIATRTQNFDVPYRPSADASCTGGKWKAADGTCNNGFAFKIAFDLRSLNLTLPDNFSYDVAFNTSTYGASPLGVTGPYDSLNVGVYDATAASPTVGTDRDVGSFLRNGTLSNEGYDLMTQVILGAN